MARLTGTSVAEVRQRAAALHETNPMLGHRGCRLGITYPEIYETQAVAIFEAAATVMQETGESGRARDHDAADRDQARTRHIEGDWSIGLPAR